MTKPIKVKGTLDPQEFFTKSYESHKKWMIKIRKPVIFLFIHLYKKEYKRIQIIAVQGSNGESPMDYARTIIERFDPDYYILLGEGWATEIKKDEGETWLANHKYGDISKLPRDQRREILTVIGKTKDGKQKFEAAAEIKRNERDEIIGFEEDQFDKGTLQSPKLP